MFIFGLRPIVFRKMGFLFEDIRVNGYNDRPRLSVDELQIADDGLSVIVGPSGAGKSTLLRLCNRLDVPDSGSIIFDGKPTEAIPVLELRRQVAMVFQEPVRFAGTVLDNLREADRDLPVPVAIDLLARVGLEPDFLDQVADQLSGGEAQRMCLARALATNPSAMLMDEPTSSLDPAATRVIEDLAIRLADEGMPIIWVTHDTAQVKRLATSVVCLIAGEVAYEGSATGLFESSSPGITTFLAEQPS